MRCARAWQDWRAGGGEREQEGEWDGRRLGLACPSYCCPAQGAQDIIGAGNTRHLQPPGHLRQHAQGKAQGNAAGRRTMSSGEARHTDSSNISFSICSPSSVTADSRAPSTTSLWAVHGRV